MIEDFLSEYGKIAYIPRGFTAQSEEVNGKVIINATAGVYQVHNKIRTIPEISSQFNLSDEEIVQYVPASGYKPLRETWKDHVINNSYNNISINTIDTSCSLPVVTNGISNSLYIAGSLFIDKDDEVYIPDLHWDAYDSIFGLRLGGKLVTYDNFDLDNLEFQLENKVGKKVIVFNYPNNPTGYTLLKSEVDKLESILIKRCKKGDKIIAILDDAYFRFFFTDDCNKKSLFGRLGNLHENLMVVKCDGVSKEYCAWGMRVGFITFKSQCVDNSLTYSLLEHKAAAVNRGTLSSISMDNQVILNKAINDHGFSYYDDVFLDLNERFQILNESIERYKNDSLKVLPHNSGYFVCFETNCDAELLRKNLIEKHGVGIIRYDSHHIRIAFSSVDKDNIPLLIKLIYSEAQLI